MILRPSHAPAHAAPRAASLPRILSRALVPVALATILVARAEPTPGGSARPQPAIQVYFAADFKDGAYQKAAFEKVAKAWSPPAQLPAAGRKAVVQSTIRRNGTLGSAIVTMASGSKPWDEAALAAVGKAAPFRPFPAGYAGPQVEVHWHFELKKQAARGGT